MSTRQLDVGLRLTKLSTVDTDTNKLHPLINCLSQIIQCRNSGNAEHPPARCCQGRRGSLHITDIGFSRISKPFARSPQSDAMPDLDQINPADSSPLQTAAVS